MKMVALCSLLLVIGCGKKEDEEETSTLFSGQGQVTSWTQYSGQTASLLDAMYLTPSDFDDIEYTDATAESAEQFINGISGLFAPSQSGAAYIGSISGLSLVSYHTGSPSDFEDYNEYSDNVETVYDCVDALIGAAVIETLKSEYRFNVDIVLTPCFVDQVPDTYSNYSATLKASFYGQCDNADLEAINGMTYTEIEAEEAYAFSAFCRQQTSYASSVIYTEAYTYTSEDYEYDYVRTTKNAIFDENGRSCQKKRDGDEIYFEDGCVNYYNYENDIDFGESASTSGTMLKVTSRGVVQQFGEHDWYKSGSFDVSMGGWDGAVTYVDADTVPTWTISDGTDEISGDFAEDE